jgi:hypothetical protein
MFEKGGCNAVTGRSKGCNPKNQKGLLNHPPFLPPGQSSARPSRRAGEILAAYSQVTFTSPFELPEWILNPFDQ